jgi:predicted transcriptional regulator
MLKQENKVMKWEVPGTPAGGLRTVGQIRATNDLIFRTGQNGMSVALELLSTHTPGAPVVDDRDEFVGFISEFDVLRVLEAGKDLSELKADDIMTHGRIALTADTTIEQAVKTMKAQRLLNLPVKKNGKVTYSVTRHDLLRAWIGLGVGIEG